ncbi:MAG: hypothetical protein CM15mP74_16610 [Halieaceae bacterium]|nr:MAG: hypothetical protein CM15mP74_16610 [Halieaceae bacterium]
MVALLRVRGAPPEPIFMINKKCCQACRTLGNGGNLQARGQTTRLANKERRKARILSEARNLIAEEGFDALTISELAVRSEVTIPTVHNLLGKKNDIVLAVFRGLVDNIDAVLAEPDLVDPVLVSEVFIDKIVALYGSDEVFTAPPFSVVSALGSLSTR